MTAAGVDGAAYGALSAAGHDQDIGAGAAFGVLGGVAGQGAGEVVSKSARGLGQMLKRATGNVPKVPTTEKLEAAGRAAFQASEKAGVMLSRDGLQRLHKNVVEDLTEFGFHPSIQPHAAAALSEIERIAGGNATLKGLHTARKVASRGFTTGANATAEDNAALAQIISRIDEHIDGLRNDIGAVVLGKAEDGAKALRDGTHHWRRMAKSSEVERILQDADFVQGSDRHIRTQVGKLARKGRMTPDEFMAALDVSKGGLLRNGVTYAGRALAPNSGALGAATSLGAIGGGLWSGNASAVALPIVGYGAKAASDRVAKGKAQQLAAMMRAGGSEAALRGPDNALQRLAKSKKDLLARLLLSGALMSTPAHGGQE